MTAAEKIAKSEEYQRIFDLACILAVNVNGALQHGARHGAGRRETFADGVFEACMFALRQLDAFSGAQPFRAVWEVTWEGDEVKETKLVIKES